ncbi:hypothetical protein LA983_001030 [Vibrio fluvialis]|nr:hypothetical protein [Vibrio fluvialis]
MKSEPSFEIFHQAFSTRVEIASILKVALKPSNNSIEKLTTANRVLEELLSELGHGYSEDQYRAYCTAVSIFIVLAEWMQALRNAEIDAQRFLNSAKLKASDVDRASEVSKDQRLITFLDKVEKLDNFEELSCIHDHLTKWSLPLLMFARVPRSNLRVLRDDQSLHTEQDGPGRRGTTVAFLKFDIDGEPAKECNYLRPGTAYDLSIEVRVSDWPQEATFLSLMPVTLDIREKDWLPHFRFEKPEGDGPFTFTGVGRAVLMVANSFGSRPYEFLYAAEFDNSGSRKEVAVVGHRRLLLEGSDVASNPLSGFPHVDSHLIKVRDKLRAIPGINAEDLANAMTVLGGLGNVAAQALKGSLFEERTSEQKFQMKVSELLRSRRDIGVDLEGHPEAAGGITDLTFRDIPIELKVEKEKVLFPKDFTKFFDQTAAYAIGLGKRLGVLSVLESSPKSSPVGIVEDDIEVFRHVTGQSVVAIVVVVVRGGFPKPSSYSR